MFRMIARRRSQVDVSIGTDKVLCGMSLPSDSIVSDIKMTVEGADSGSVFKAKDQAVMYGLEGYILPVHDPDAGTTLQVLWDQLVIKDTDTELIDLDTGATDATPFFEPGEINWNMVLDVGLRPQKIYGKYELLTFASPGQFRFQDNATPFAGEWTPTALVNVRIRRPLRIKQPSVLVFGWASPSMDDTTTTEETALTEPNWSQVKYMEETLERAHMTLIGLTEAGATTPYVEASALIKTHLEPDVFEEDADKYVGIGWRVFAEMMVGHSVKGRFGKTILSTGR